MRIGIINDATPMERRVTLTPDAVSKLIDEGWDVVIESGAGSNAGFADEAYRQAGAKVTSRQDSLGADVVLVLTPPDAATVGELAAGTVVVGFIDPLGSPDTALALAKAEVTVFSLEQIPRTTIAQTMDALSSQATAGGYAAVLAAANESTRFFPMLITAAGTMPPTKVLILGVGVAGLQAIATARRLGAVVSAYDIRPETREQVESLGATFVAAPTQQFDAGGYARAVSEEIQAEQQEALSSAVAESDIVITTAMVPGRAAPRLITDSMIRRMKAGAIILDMAAASGGNVEHSIADSRVEVHGVIILGPTDLPSRVAGDASRMLAKNITSFLALLFSTEDGFDFDNEIVAGSCVAHGGDLFGTPSGASAADSRE